MRFHFFWHSLYMLREKGWKDIHQNIDNSNSLVVRTQYSNFYYPFSTIFLIFNYNPIFILLRGSIFRCLFLKGCGQSFRAKEDVFVPSPGCSWPLSTESGWPVQWSEETMAPMASHLPPTPPTPHPLPTPSPREWRQGIEGRSALGLDAVRTQGFS